METTNATAYERAVATRDQLRAEQRVEDERHAAEAKRLMAGIIDAERVISIAEDLGPEMAEAYDVGHRILDVRWMRRDRERPTTGEVGACFADAVEDLRRGAPRLQLGYFGVKAYDRWPSQRHDSEYGYGPSHGSIWFQIRLKQPRAVALLPLTEGEKIACVQYLMAIMAGKVQP